MSKIQNIYTRARQPYMRQKSLENSGIEFLWESNIIETRVNMKGMYEKEKYQSPHCTAGSLETSDHLMICSMYADLREGSNPESIIEKRASYLRKVIQRRKSPEHHLRTQISVQSD